MEAKLHKRYTDGLLQHLPSFTGLIKHPISLDWWSLFTCAYAFILCSSYILTGHGFHACTVWLYRHVFYFIQDVCRLPSTWHALHVDWLHYLLRRLRYHSWRVWWLLGRCWGSRATVAPHHGGYCAWAFHGYRRILQCPGRYNGWPAYLAAALSHSCQTNANQGECYHRVFISCLIYHGFTLLLMFGVISSRNML